MQGRLFKLDYWRILIYDIFNSTFWLVNAWYEIEHTTNIASPITAARPKLTQAPASLASFRLCWVLLGAKKAGLLLDTNRAQPHFSFPNISNLTDIQQDLGRRDRANVAWVIYDLCLRQYQRYQIVASSKFTAVLSRSLTRSFSDGIALRYYT